VVLRGEDFPSLKATLPAMSGPEKKQKDGLSQKQKQVLSEELDNKQMDGSSLSRVVDIRPQMQARNNLGNGLDEYGGDNRQLGRSVISENAETTRVLGIFWKNSKKTKTKNRHVNG